MPLRGLIGSDILANRPDIKIIDNPFVDDDPIVALPAIQPDVALFHVPLADRAGNLYIARQAELKIMAHAARQTFVTAEANRGLQHPRTRRTRGGEYLVALCNGDRGAPKGSWPLNLPGHYASTPKRSPIMRVPRQRRRIPRVSRRHVLSEAGVAA